MPVATSTSIEPDPRDTTVSFSNISLSSYSSSSSSLTSRLFSSINRPTITRSTESLATATGSPPIVSNSSSGSSSSVPANVLSSPSSSFTASPTDSPALAPKPILTKPQIAGVAVAGIACAAIVFGLLFFLFCLRRKRNGKRDSGSSFGGDHVVEILPTRPSTSATLARYPQGVNPPGGPTPARVQQPFGVPNRASEKSFSFWRKSVKPEDIGVAVAPEMVQDINQDSSPISVASYRTTSQLLPDKPLYTLFPTPLRSGPSLDARRTLRRLDEDTEYTVPPSTGPPKPAHRGWNSTVTSQAAIPQGMVRTQTSNADPFVDNYHDPRAQMYAMERRRAESRSRLSRIIPPDSRAAQRNSWRQPQTSFPPNQHIDRAIPPILAVGQASRYSKPQSQSVDPIVYPSRTTFAPINWDTNPQTVGRRSVPEHRKSTGRRPLTHYTNASDTSFEDDLDEVDELPARGSGLSPVAESPKTRTPLSEIRYPSIPHLTASPKERRPSPESPTRRPQKRKQVESSVENYASKNTGKGREVVQRPSHPAREDSLLAKRRGSQEAMNIAREVKERQDVNNSPVGSAKWKILVSPGLEGIENHGPSHNARSPAKTGIGTSTKT
ncbi:hypothetical protein MMC24_003030 [Lignoscripta atroalba]|nr:hypothetical protein [Lignoscripta atroalba]